MKNLYTNKLGILFLIIPICQVFGQPTTFNKVLPPDGKAFITIEGIAQDEDGFMWFSTRNGLYKFDGYQMISYKHNPLDENSLVTDSLTKICIDKTGKIWIGTMGFGLVFFDPASKQVKHYNLDSLGGNWINSMLVDSEGILWIAADGLYRYIKETDSFVHFQNISGDTTSLSNNYVNVIYEDKQGTIWVGAGAIWDSDKKSAEFGGLNRMNKKTGTFTRFMHDPDNPASLINNKVSAVIEDSKGTFWVGTAGDGLHTMDREKETFIRHTYNPKHPKKLSRPPLNNLDEENQRIEFITFIQEDATGAIWIGSLRAGINYFNPNTGETTNLGFDNDGGTTLNGFKSRDGVMWISTLWGNLYNINPSLKQFPHFETSSGGANTFYEEPNGTLWIGTGKELIRNNKAKGIINRDVIHVNPLVDDDNYITIIKSDRQENVWIGSIGGLTKWDKKKDSFIHYKVDIKNNDWLGNIVYKIFEDTEDNLWIGKRRGLSLFNRETGSFSQFLFYPNDSSSSWINAINDIIQDKTGNLWVSTGAGGGINLFNPVNKNFKTYLKGKNITCFCEDATGVLWVGGDGLYKFEPVSDNFIPYIDSIPFSVISDINTLVEDNQRNLWLGTSNGLVRINPQRNRMYFYGKEYGVGENSLLWESYKGRNGDLYFGNESGYFSFNPKEFAKNVIPPQIVFAGFFLGDQDVKPDLFGPLKESLSHANEIKLSYNQNVFTFEFAALDYSNPEETKYSCMLENYDTDWRKGNSERRAYYFNVPPGKYVFHVKAVTSNGVWAEKKIDVIILPPWWKTWWAYCIYGLLLIAAIFGFDRFMRQRIMQAEKERNRERELAQAKEIEKAYTELKSTQAQLIQSEKMASLGELTAGIAHEIQNPLNFVNNFSEISSELMEEMKEELLEGSRQWAAGSRQSGEEKLKLAVEIAEDIKQNLEKINHHGKRAADIVKGMLQHSRTSSGVKEPTDINALADEYLRLAYHGLRAKDKTFNVDFKTEFDESLPKIKVIPQDLGRVLLNLINNAFYAVDKKAKEDHPLTPKGEMKNDQNMYRPTVTICTTSSKSPSGDLGVEIRVKDNGPGIPLEIKDKIFQPFFTTKPTGQGTGLGLSLAYDIVKAHGGELKVETKEGEGSEFIINLPIN